MPRSTTSLSPDINVWAALTYEGHVHHTTAATWFTDLQPDVTLAFCRFTQLGLLRLLTTAVVMGDEVMTQPRAWAAATIGGCRILVSRSSTSLLRSNRSFALYASSPAGDQGLG